MAKKPKEDARSQSEKQPIRSVRQGQVNRTGQSEASITGQSIGRTNQIAFTNKRRRADCPIRFILQEARRTPRHTRWKHRISQLEPSVGLSSVGLSLDGLSFDGISLDGSSLKTESSAQPITSIGWTILGRTFFGRLLNRFITVTFFGESTRLNGFWYRQIRSLRRLFNRYKRSQSLESSSRLHGQNLQPKSLTRKSRTITAANKSPMRK